MLTASIRNATLALAAGGLALAAPASAVPMAQSRAYTDAAPVYGETTFNQYDRGRHGGWDERGDRRDYRGYRGYDSYSGYNQGYNQGYNRYRGQAWRGDDGRYYCRRSNGTTGLIVGGAAGALLGREVAGRYGDRTLGTILGAAGGALLGKSVDSGTRCR